MRAEIESSPRSAVTIDEQVIERRTDEILEAVGHSPRRFHWWLLERERERVHTIRWSATVHEVVSDEAREHDASRNLLCVLPIIKRNMRRIARRVAEKEWERGKLKPTDAAAAQSNDVAGDELSRGDATPSRS